MALTDDKYHQKQATLVERTSVALNVAIDDARKLLSIQRRQSIRINTLKAPVDTTLKELSSLGMTVESVPWLSHGYFATDNLELVRDSDLSSNGLLYIQNAASWLPIVALNPQPGDTILDMCAAPGGKTSHIAQLGDNKVTITANDNSRPRLHKLQANLERLGVENVTFTLHDASRLTHRLEPESFDKILLDAPCSGEGMMTLDDRKSFESWSVAHIKRLQKLQKKLIVQAWQLLKPGGTLVYSTCTMAPDENEAVIDYLLRHNDNAALEDLTELKQYLEGTVQPVIEWNGKSFDARTSNALRLKPTPEVEAFFVAKLIKR